MCHASVLAFAERVLRPDDIRGRDVLEVGSYNVNGSVRAHVEAMVPTSYLGIDQQPGPGVDRVVPADDLLRTFGPESWDVVICTEVLEHVLDWRTVAKNLQGVLRFGGLLLITTRSKGFPYHPYPIDTWRYEIADMRAIFSDFEIDILESDPEAPGVLMKAKRSAYRERHALAPDLYTIHLFAMGQTTPTGAPRRWSLDPVSPSA
jgi:SAM-dependent methyltransferase